MKIVEYRDREQAEEEIGNITRTKMKITPSCKREFALDIRFFMSGSLIGVECKDHSGGHVRYEDEVRCINICKRDVGMMTISNGNDKIEVCNDNIVIFDTWKTNEFSCVSGTYSSFVCIAFNHLTEISHVYTDKTISDSWEGIAVLDNDVKIRQGLLSLMSSVLINIDLCYDRPGEARHSSRLCEEALVIYMLEYLKIFGNTFSDDAIAIASNRQVQRALDIIRSDTRIESLAELALNVGVSVRALQHAFRQHTGISPYTAIKKERLRKARKSIERGEINSINELRALFSISNISRFNQEYMDIFGETPYSNIRRIRRRL